MISQATFNGRSKTWSSAVDITLCAHVARLNLVTMTTTGKKVLAEDARYFQGLGGPIYYVRNSGSNSFTFADNAGTVLATVTAGQVLEAHVVDKSTAAGVWRVRVKTPLS